MGFTCAPAVTSRAVVSYTALPPLRLQWATHHARSSNRFALLATRHSPYAHFSFSIRHARSSNRFALLATRHSPYAMFSSDAYVSKLTTPLCFPWRMAHCKRGTFLLHWPWSRLHRTLSGILPCEARTFLTCCLSASAAAITCLTCWINAIISYFTILRQWSDRCHLQLLLPRYHIAHFADDHHDLSPRQRLLDVLLWLEEAVSTSLHSSQGYKKTTNNRMELMAVIAGLEALNRPCEVTLYSDSKYVVDAFNQHWIDGCIIGKAVGKALAVWCNSVSQYQVPAAFPIMQA